MRRLGVLAACLVTSISSGAASAEPNAPLRGTALGSPLLSRSTPAQAASDAALEELAPLWTFHAGAPLRAGAGLGEGGIAVATSDGYVHALRTDGSYRWSFTVKGAVTATPLVDARGAIYVATSTRRLYALTSGGKLAWSVALTGTALDPLRWSQAREVLIATREGVAYAITTSGVRRAAVALGEALTAPPLPLASGSWLVGGETGQVFSLSGWRVVSRERPAGSPVRQLVARDQSYVGLSSEGLFSPQGALEPSAERLGCGPERVLIVTKDGRIGELDGNQATFWPKAVGEPLSAPPACLSDGRALLPLASGALLVMARSGDARRWSLGSAALFTPTVDEARGQLVVSAADGRSLALPLEAL